MVNQAAFESHSFGQDPGGEQLAEDVNDKVSMNLLDDAYKTLKDGVNSYFQDRPLSEKQEFWNDVSRRLENSGAMPRLSAAFLEDIATPPVGRDGKPQTDRTIAGTDGKIQRSELAGVSGAINPMYKGMATEALKQFDTAAALHNDDGVIDMGEVVDFKQRQTMPDRDQYVDTVIQNLERKLNENPDQAMKYLQQSMSGRARLETPAESQETWKQLAESMKEHGLVDRLSMAFLRSYDQYIDMDHNGSYSKPEVERFQKSLNPVINQFAGHIVDNFATIGTVDYKLDEISKHEVQVYENRVNRAPSEPPSPAEGSGHAEPAPPAQEPPRN